MRGVGCWSVGGGGFGCACRNRFLVEEGGELWVSRNGDGAGLMKNLGARVGVVRFWMPLFGRCVKSKRCVGVGSYGLSFAGCPGGRCGRVFGLRLAGSWSGGSGCW